MSDDKKKMLEHVASAAEREARQHDEGCHWKSALNAVAQTARAAATTSGPAQVATLAYRENYETIFGRVPVGQA